MTPGTQGALAIGIWVHPWSTGHSGDRGVLGEAQDEVIKAPDRDSWRLALKTKKPGTVRVAMFAHWQHTTNGDQGRIGL